MRDAGRVVGNTLSQLRGFVKPGISTMDISDFCKEKIEEQGAIASSINYHGFPGAACTSVNDALCHGIPLKNQILNNGDVIKIDITCDVDGWYGDSCYTYGVGDIDQEIEDLNLLGRKCLRAGLKVIKPGAKLVEIGRAIEELATANNAWVCRAFCGHGIGQKMHQEPQVLHWDHTDEEGSMELIEGMFLLSNL
eukprot:UN25533